MRTIDKVRRKLFSLYEARTNLNGLYNIVEISPIQDKGNKYSTTLILCNFLDFTIKFSQGYCTIGDDQLLMIKIESSEIKEKRVNGKNLRKLDLVSRHKAEKYLSIFLIDEIGDNPYRITYV